MKIYVASSWRCEYQPEAVRKLRALGHEVYDFRGAGDGWGDTPGSGGFSWSEVDPNWQSWPDDVPRYLRGLNHPRAIEGFDRDMDALIRADACLLVNPCGQSAHAEFGWACGAGKLTAAWCPAIREPDLMLKMAGFITDEWPEIERWSLEAPHAAFLFTQGWEEQIRQLEREMALVGIFAESNARGCKLDVDGGMCAMGLVEGRDCFTWSRLYARLQRELAQAKQGWREK